VVPELPPWYGKDNDTIKKNENESDERCEIETDLSIIVTSGCWRMVAKSSLT
jgi:hypothetical protein